MENSIFQLATNHACVQPPAFVTKKSERSLSNFFLRKVGGCTQVRHSAVNIAIQSLQV